MPAPPSDGVPATVGASKPGNESEAADPTSEAGREAGGAPGAAAVGGAGGPVAGVGGAGGASSGGAAGLAPRAARTERSCVRLRTSSS
eukprot:14806900-Alexandrium_andersonii.AAC.1